DRSDSEHYVYLGADHSFRPDLTGSVRVGARFIDYYNDPTGSGGGWGPYAMLNLVWTYAPDSRLEIGVSHDINTTDITGGENFRNSTNQLASFTLSQET